MSGSVWEWVQDEWHDNYDGAPIDGSGWCVGDCPENASDSNYNAGSIGLNHRVLRGGYWGNGASFIRAAYRVNVTPSGQSYHYGGRLARSILSTFCMAALSHSGGR